MSSDSSISKGAACSDSESALEVIEREHELEEGGAEAGTERGTETESDSGSGLGSVLLSADSDRDPTVSIIMPTLNEEQGIAECITRVESALRELGVVGEIIVSDSSTDRTPEIARERGAIIVTPDAPGYGYAYRYAFEHARGEYIAIGDADTTYDFEELPRLYRLVESGETDMAVGSRLAGTIEPGAMPLLHRYVGNPLLTRFLNVFYGVGMTDAHSGMRVVSRSALDRLDFTADGMEFASEMIMVASERGLRIEETPITYHPRTGNATIHSFRDGWRHVRFMLVNAPGYLFSVPGLVMGTVGLFVMALAYSPVTIFGQPFGIHSLVAGSLLALIGYQVVSLGAFTAVAGDPIRTPTDPITQWIVGHVRLEQGASVGLLVFLSGAAYAAYLASEWFLTSDLPYPMSDIVALTAIVLGLQIIFGSFFLSAIAD